MEYWDAFFNYVRKMKNMLLVICRNLAKITVFDRDWHNL